MKCVLLILLLLIPFTSNAAPTSYSGRAIGALVALTPPNTLVFADTGDLPSSGGIRHADLATISIPTVLHSTVITADCSAGSGVSNSTASQNNVALFDLHPSAIRASVVTAQAHADCGGVSGSSVVSDLRVDGNSIVVTGAPNQTVAIAAFGTLVINEQIISGLSITVNAIHLTLGTGESVILSSAHADILCSVVPTKPLSWGRLKTFYH